MPPGLVDADSSLPRPELPIPLTVSAAPRTTLASQPGCTICQVGSVHTSWSGASGSFSLDRLENRRSSGTTGSLRLQVRVSSTYPVFGSTISSYALSDVYSLGQLSAGQYYTGLFSGTQTFYQNIPAGTYYAFLMSYEYSGSTWYYTDFTLFDSTVSCNGACSATSASTPTRTATPTPTATAPAAATATRTPTPTTPTSGGGCTEDTLTLCLYGGRFEVRAGYVDYSGNSGSGRAVRLTSDAGYFWFFAQSNVELVAKMVPFCGSGGGNIAFYGSGLTDVAVTFRVRDTRYGTVREYRNPLGSRFQTIADGPFGCN